MNYFKTRGKDLFKKTQHKKYLMLGAGGTNSFVFNILLFGTLIIKETWIYLCNMMVIFSRMIKQILPTSPE